MLFTIVEGSIPVFVLSTIANLNISPAMSNLKCLPGLNILKMGTSSDSKIELQIIVILQLLMDHQVIIIIKLIAKK